MKNTPRGYVPIRPGMGVFSVFITSSLCSLSAVPRSAGSSEVTVDGLPNRGAEVPAHGIARVSFTSKSRTVTRIKYDPEVKLAKLNIAGDLEIEQYLKADQLDELLRDGAKALGQMLDDPGAIGLDTLNDRQASQIDRLSHLLDRGDLR